MAVLFMFRDAYGPKYLLQAGRSYILDDVVDAALIAALQAPDSDFSNTTAARIALPSDPAPQDSGRDGS
jgi:hypothetical protein